MNTLEFELLERIALALERMADSQESARNPSAFHSRYNAAKEVEATLLEQDDSELAAIERKDRERLGAGGEAAIEDDYDADTLGLEK